MMSLDDLLTEFDTGRPDDVAGLTDDTPPADVPASESAVRLDSFDRRQATDATAAFEYLAEAAKRTSDDAVADFFGSAYKVEPTVHDHVTPEVKQRRDFVRTLMDDPDYQAMHGRTMLRYGQSAIAATEFAERFAKAAESTPPPAKDAAGRPDPKATERQQAAHLRRHAHAAAAKVAESVEEFEACCDAAGLDPGNLSPVQAGEMLAAFKTARSNPTVHAIMRLAGRYKLAAVAAQRQKVLHGRDEVVGIEFGNDLSRVLPAELGRLSHEALQLDFMRRFADRALMQYETHASEPQNRGPIVVCVDESGSMSGERIQNAKALSLAMLWIARHQKRDCVCIGFSSPGKFRTFRFPGGRADPTKLNDWLGNMLDGGTCFETPLRQALKAVDELQRRADILFITDDCCTVSEEFRQEFVAAKRAREIKCIGISVAAGEPTTLRELCDRVHVATALSVSSAATLDAVSV